MFIFSFENRNIPAENYEALLNVLTRRLHQRRCVISDNEPDLRIAFELDSSLEKDSYKVSGTASEVLVSADCVANIFAGIGRFLLLGFFDGNGNFEVPALPIRYKMKKSVRGIYLASHFYNFHHNAPMEEECNHIAEQALRGFNALMMVVGIQHYNSMQDPEAVEMTERVKKQLNFGRLCGMSAALILFSNTGFANYPKELASTMTADEHGHYKVNLVAEFITEVCPSKPEGLEYCRRQIEDYMKAFSDTKIDYYYIWPYDEGGCQCDDCYPWATNGFMKVATVARELMAKYSPESQMCISTWHFNLSNPNEWDDFYAHLATGEYSWAPYIMTAFQSGRLPQCIVKNGVPEGVRFIDFPEISMQNPAKPWGGYGAIPIPMYLNNVEENCGAIHDGGYLYSEGRYEDLNKFLVAAFYTGYYKNTNDALRDYFRSEFGVRDEAMQNELIRACELMESSLKRTLTPPTEEGGAYTFLPRWGTAIPEIVRIIDKVDASLAASYEKSWQWRLMVTRAHIDFELYKHGWKMKDNPVAQKYIKEVWDISYACEHSKFAIKPPLGL